MELLYQEAIITLNREGTNFEYNQEVFDEAARWIHQQGGFTSDMLTAPPAMAVIQETFRVLNTAVSSSIGLEVPETLSSALNNNAFVFSGLKTYHSLNEVGLSLTDGKGAVKDFDTFYQDVEKIHGKYNRNYLYAEYNYAVQASQMAVKWNDWEVDGDRYDLQYRTAGDGKVRASHAVLHNITLPKSDPFWNDYLPPNDWNCRCTVVQVRKNKYEVSDSGKSIELGEEMTSDPKKKMFRFNPGKELKVFPDKHPYQKAPAKVKKTVENLAKEVKTAQDVVDTIKELETTNKWFEHGFKSLEEERSRGANGSTDCRGKIWLTKERLELTISGIDKLRKGKEIEKKEADALATFWHEITHNRNKANRVYMTNKQRQYMELANELVARNTLPDFYNAFGSKIQHKELMKDRQSTGYNTMVNNYVKVIEKVGLKKDDVVKIVREHLFTEEYSTQKNGLAAGLEGAKKLDGSKLKKSEINSIVGKCPQYSETVFERVLDEIIR